MNKEDEEIIEQIKGFNNRKWIKSNLDELEILKVQLESLNYEVKVWNFKKRIRTAVIYNGYRLY